jgi:hypothetical protein
VDIEPAPEMATTLVGRSWSPLLDEAFAAAGQTGQRYYR